MPRSVTPLDVPDPALPRAVVEAPEERSTSPDPFADVPSPRRVAVTYLLGLVAMIATLTVIGVVLTSTDALEGVREWDLSISSDVADNRTADAVDLARFITKTGDTLAILGLMAAVTIVLAVLRKWRAILFLPMAMLAEITTFLSVNQLVGRERPPVEKLGPLARHVQLPVGSRGGDTRLLGRHRRAPRRLRVHQVGRARRWIAGAVMAAAMAWARVYAGMHYTTDVIFGFAMGVAALVLVVLVLRIHVFRTLVTGRV